MPAATNYLLQPAPPGRPTRLFESAPAAFFWRDGTSAHQEHLKLNNSKNDVPSRRFLACRSSTRFGVSTTSPLFQITEKRTSSVVHLERRQYIWPVGIVAVRSCALRKMRHADATQDSGGRREGEASLPKYRMRSHPLPESQGRRGCDMHSRRSGPAL
jgi:hypothetical protein